jgi:hydroxymethylglutaryl-CoA lyase
VIPRLDDAEEVLRRVEIPPGVDVTVLIPNERGLDRALEVRPHFAEINCILSASESHQHNVNRSVADSFRGLEAAIGRARTEGLWVEGVISTAFGCPYESKVEPSAFSIARRLIDAGAVEIAFGDTTGMANPVQVSRFCVEARRTLDEQVELTAHFHKTRGQGLANVLSAVEAGWLVVRVELR